MKKYFVIATRWNDEIKAQSKTIVGTFDEYYLADMFRVCYNDKFSASAVVMSSEELLNA